jgi:hypothetical protein
MLEYAMDAHSGTYPPLETLKPVAQEVWIVDGAVRRQSRPTRAPGAVQGFVVASQSRTIERQWNARSDEAVTTASTTATDGWAASQAVIRSPIIARALAVVAENTWTRVIRRDTASDEPGGVVILEMATFRGT